MQLRSRRCSSPPRPSSPTSPSRPALPAACRAACPTWVGWATSKVRPSSTSREWGVLRGAPFLVVFGSSRRAATLEERIVDGTVHLQVAIDGEAFSADGDKIEMTMEITDFGVPVDVQAPPADQTV